MKFKVEPEVEQFRSEIREFIGAELPPESERPDPGQPGHAPEYKGYVQGFQKKLAQKNWLAMAWPKEYGGGGASHMHQVVYNEEMSYAGAPSGNHGCRLGWPVADALRHRSSEGPVHPPDHRGR